MLEVSRDGSSARKAIWDIHTHCLACIDDGARSWEMSLQMLKASWENGVRTLIATPHFLPWKEPIPADRIRSLCEEAMDRCNAELGIRIRILPGEELYYYEGMTDDLRTGRALTLAGSRAVLVEFSERVPWTELRTGLISLRRSGYRPILAHAERYSCIRKDGRYEEILESGIYIQSNLQEVEGGLFGGPGRWVRRQLREHTIHFMASDMHNLDSRPPVSASQMAWLDKKVDEEYRMQLLGGNIQKLLEKG